MLGLWLNTTTHKMILLPYLLFFFYVHNVISLLIIVFFRLPCPPLAKRGSLTHSQALALSKRARDVTAPPVALNRYAIRLAGHQSPRQFFVRDGTAGGRLAKTIGCAGWDRIAESLAESLAESGGIRGLVRGVLAGMNPQGEDLLKLFARDGTAGRLSCYSTFDRITSGVVPIRVIADIL